MDRAAGRTGPAPRGDRVSDGGGIGINASIIGASPTGLGLYSINLVRALDALRGDLTVYTSCPEAVAPLRARVLRTTRFARPERGLRGHFARLIWVQTRSEEHTSELQSLRHLVCRLLL